MKNRTEENQVKKNMLGLYNKLAVKYFGHCLSGELIFKSFSYGQTWELSVYLFHYIKVGNSSSSGKKVMRKGTVAKEQDFYFPKIKTSSPLHSFSSSLKKK